MTDSDSTNATPATPMGQAEMSALATRLRARADSVLFRDQPEQARDLKSSAALIDELVRVRAELRRAADATEDESTERHLRELLGGG